MTTPRGKPASYAHCTCSSAISGLVLKLMSCGTPASSRRAASSTQVCGKYSRYATGRLAAWLAIDTVTAT